MTTNVYWYAQIPSDEAVATIPEDFSEDNTSYWRDVLPIEMDGYTTYYFILSADDELDDPEITYSTVRVYTYSTETDATILYFERYYYAGSGTPTIPSAYPPGDGWLTDFEGLEEPIPYVDYLIYSDGSVGYPEMIAYYNAEESELFPSEDDDPPEEEEIFGDVDIRKIVAPDIDSAVEVLREEITTLLRIESSRGTVFKNDAVATVLSVVIYHGTQRITDSETMKSIFGESAYLQWKWLRIDDETFGIISAGDTRFGDNGFTFSLSPEDVDTKVTFMCELIT